VDGLESQASVATPEFPDIQEAEFLVIVVGQECPAIVVGPEFLDTLEVVFPVTVVILEMVSPATLASVAIQVTQEFLGTQEFLDTAEVEFQVTVVGPVFLDSADTLVSPVTVGTQESVDGLVTLGSADGQDTQEFLDTLEVVFLVTVVTQEVEYLDIPVTPESVDIQDFQQAAIQDIPESVDTVGGLEFQDTVEVEFLDTAVGLGSADTQA
jgi:hypothetical protein